MLFSRNIKNETLSLQDEALLEFLGISTSYVDIQGKNALKVATIFGCLRILTESIGKIPLKIYKDGKKDTSHYLYRLLSIRPNPLMSAIDFWKTIEFNRAFTGNGYAYIDFDNRTGYVKGLYPIETKKIVAIYIDDVKLTKKRMWYVIEDQGEHFKISFEQMLHFKGMTDNGLIGLDPVKYLKDIVESAKSGQEYVNNFYKNGMQSKGIIQYIGDLNEKAEENFKDKFERMSSGLSNAHRVSLLPFGYQYQAISQNLAESQFLENNSLTIRQIASAFGVKMHQINDLTRATYANIEEATKEFYVETLQPVLTTYEQEMMYKLWRRDELSSGYYCKFNIDVILRSDLEKRFNSYRNAIQYGIHTPNEVRELEEQEPHGEWADKLYFNGNMIPMEMAGQQYKEEGGA